MPTTTSHIYLNTGSFGPLPTCVVQALQERIQDEWQNGRLGPAVFEATSMIYGNARRGVAHLLNADVDDIALSDSPGDGLNIISYGLTAPEGHELITPNHEHLTLLP